METEVETYESVEELKSLQEHEFGSLSILDELNEKELNYPRMQAMFKRSRHKISSTFLFSQDCNELPKKTIRAIGSISHIFKPSIFRDVQNLYQNEGSMDMTPDEFKYLTSTCWDKKYQPLTIDLTKDKYTCRYRLGFFSFFIPDRSRSQLTK